MISECSFIRSKGDDLSFFSSPSYTTMLRRENRGVTCQCPPILSDSFYYCSLSEMRCANEVFTVAVNERSLFGKIELGESI
jgi:hypothetical protein